MTKFFLKWWVDRSRMPASPQEAVGSLLKMCEAVKAELSSGKLTEWESFGNGKDGYCIIDGTQQDVVSTMLKYVPNVAYELHPVLSVDDAIAALEKAAKAMQA
jgi:hypothetical protein